MALFDIQVVDTDTNQVLSVPSPIAVLTSAEVKKKRIYCGLSKLETKSDYVQRFLLSGIA